MTYLLCVMDASTLDVSIKRQNGGELQTGQPTASDPNIAKYKLGLG